MKKAQVSPKLKSLLACITQCFLKSVPQEIEVITQLSNGNQQPEIIIRTIILLQYYISDSHTFLLNNDLVN